MMIFCTVMLQNSLTEAENIMIIFGFPSIPTLLRNTYPLGFLRTQDFPDDRNGIAVADVFRLKIDHRSTIIDHLR